MRTFFIRLRSNWMRNLLAILQVAVAIAAVTGVFTSILPALRLSNEEHEPTTFQLRFGVRRGAGMTFTGIFHADDPQYLLEQSDTLVAASVYQTGLVSVIAVGDDRYAVSSVGRVSPGYDQLAGLEMLDGDFFTAAETDGSTARVVVISDRLAQMLFGDQPALGQHINLRPDEESRVLTGIGGLPINLEAVRAMPGTDLEVIGVFRMTERRSGPLQPHLYTPALNMREPTPIPMLPPGATSSGAPLPVPVVSASQQVYTEMIVKAKDGMGAEAQEEVLSLLRTRISGRPQAERLMDGMQPDVMIDVMQDVDALLRTSRLQQSVMTGAMGLVALIVAGFAIFTTTLANITQRTRTIGLARSIGATRGLVIRDVVSEAALLAGLGGLIGALVAQPLSKHVLTPIQGAIGQAGVTVLDALLAGGAGVVLAMAIGALAALYPAWTVARLMPSEAWREGRV